MIARIDEARSAGDTVGGVFEVVVHGAPIGLGSYVHWDRRLDAALAAAVMGINIVKGVELGLGFEQTRRFGSGVHDVIEGRRPLRMEGAAGWAAAHTAWVVWSLAKGPGPAISHHDDWVVDNLELFDGAAWWLAWELGVEPPPQLTDRQVGWEAG